MMKKILVSLLLSVAVAMAASTKNSNSSSGQSGSSSKNMGVGAWIQAGNAGEHFGLDFMMRMGSDITLDIYAHLFLSDGDNSLGLYLGYYWNFYLSGVPRELGRMGFYAGPTGGLGFWDNYHSAGWDGNRYVWWRDETGFAIRMGIAGGYQWEFPKIPLQFYMELSPVIEFHYYAWDDYYYDDRDRRRNGDYDDTDVDWKFPDFYFRVGLRFWF
ncbi:MAG: hypothetical protein HUK19_00055 [Fibrobacter sp.]|nr:hypothetical protein [Fibrobacter sp.]